MIDRPRSEAHIPPAPEPEASVIEPEVPVSLELSAARKVADFTQEEYPSPAFIKRARLSYGALFEGGFDTLEDDGGVKGKGRKRTRFGRDSSAWRYASQSPSPEPTSPVQDAMDVDQAAETGSSPSSRPQMMDEASQTVEMLLASPNAKVAPYHAVLPLQHSRDNNPLVPYEKTIVTVERDVSPLNLFPAPIKTVSNGDRVMASGLTAPNQVQQTQQTLFGTFKQAHPEFSLFGSTTAAANPGPELNFTDQVRFGFSHVSRNLQTQVVPVDQSFGQPDNHQTPEYPETYLEPPRPAKYTDISHDDDVQGNADMKPTSNSEIMINPPVIEEFQHRRWDMAAQSPYYNQAERGHFGTDALNEACRISTGDAELHTDAMSAEKVPEGFPSYGGNLDTAGAESEVDEVGSAHISQAEDKIAKSSASDESSEGRLDNVGYEDDGRLEEGDYDQRNYNIPDNDDQGTSEEDEENEEGAVARYGEPYTYDEDEEDRYGEDEEDGYGEQWEEDEDGDEGENEGNDENEDDDDDDWERSSRPRRAPLPSAQPAQPAAPVFISLLSDSEDDDEPPPAQVHPPVPPPTHQQHPSARERILPETKSENSPNPAVLLSASRAVESAMELVDAASTRSGAGAIDLVDSGRAEESDDENLQSSDYEQSDSEDTVSESGILTRGQDTDVDSDGNADGESKSLSGVNKPHQSGIPSDIPYSENKVGSEFGVEGEGEESLSKDFKPSSVPQVDRERMEVDDERQIMVALDEPEAQNHELKTHNERLETHALANAMDEAASSPMQKREVELATQQVDVNMAEAEPLANSQRQLASKADSCLATVEAGSTQTSSQSLLNKSAASALANATIDPHVEPTPVSVFKHHNVAKNPLSFEKPHVFARNAHESTTLPTSPPLTQSFESHISNQTNLFSPERERPGSKEGALFRQLPTPMESQITVDMVSQSIVVEDYEVIEASTPSLSEVQQHISQSLVEADTSLRSPLREGGEEGKPDVVDGSVTAQPVVDPETTSVKSQNAEDLTEDIEESRSPKLPDTTLYTQVDDSVLSIHYSGADKDEFVADDNTMAQSVSPSVGAGIANEANDQVSPRVETRSARKRRQAAEKGRISNHVAAHTRRTRTSESNTIQQQPEGSSPDPSVSLARAAAAKRPKKAPEPLRTGPMMTRARSNSLQMSASPENEEQDTSVYLAQAALASPSKIRRSQHTRTVSLKSEIAKIIPSQHDCLPLDQLREHVGDCVSAVAVVANQAPPLFRAKKGSRDHIMSFNLTDTSTAPNGVVAVQLYRPHSESMPVVHPGDVIYLQNLVVEAISQKGFGLRSAEGSAWAVFDADFEPPQIRGPPIEDWQQYREYASLLRTWYQSMDEAAKTKLDKANKKFEAVRENK